MDNCKICGVYVEEHSAIELSKDLEGHFICADCADRLRALRRLASNADEQFTSELELFISDIDLNSNIEDSVIAYLSSYIRRLKRIYKEACMTRDTSPVNNRQKESIRSDRQPISTPNTKLSKKRIFKPVMIAIGVVIGIIAIVLIAINSGFVGSTRMWTCDTCGKTWRGVAYYGLHGDEVLCDECAKSYWSPLPYKDYQISSNQEINKNSEEETVYNDQTENSQNEQVESQVDYEPIYAAYGSFSEGKAYVQIEGVGGCYIDNSGNMLFTLPSDMPYGFEFSEGYAVITNLHYREYYTLMEEEMFEKKYGIDREYALIDASGNYIVEPDQYEYISSVSEGKYFCVEVDEAATGTTTIYSVKDLNGNTVCTIENGHIIDFDAEPLIVNDILYIFNNSKVTTYNMSGDLLARTFDSANLSARNAVSRVADSAKIVCNMVGGYTYIADLRNDSTVQIPTFEHTDGAFSVNGYIMQQSEYGADNLNSVGSAWLVDKTGATATSQFTIKGASGWAKNVDNDLWIIELSNDYYAVIKLFDTNGQLSLGYAFDPVQEELVYLGEGYFLGVTSYSVWDTDGNYCYTMPSGCDKIVEHYSEGRMIAALDWLEEGDFAGYGNYCFIDYYGNIISSLNQLNS